MEGAEISVMLKSACGFGGKTGTEGMWFAPQSEKPSGFPFCCFEEQKGHETITQKGKKTQQKQFPAPSPRGFLGLGCAGQYLSHWHLLQVEGQRVPGAWSEMSVV